MAIKDAQQTKLVVGPPSQRFSDRAKARLRIAAVLLGRRGLSPEASGEDFYARVLGVIASLDPKKRYRLREHVDWVEDYERVERGVAPRR